MQNRARWLRRKFLRRARSDEGAYRDEICHRGTTKLLREKIKQAPAGIYIESAKILRYLKTNVWFVYGKRTTVSHAIVKAHPFIEKCT